MSYSSDLTAVQTNTHTDVTVKTAPASITPANVGTNLEQLVTVLLSGDLNKIISLGGDVQNQLVTFRDPISTLFCSIDPATSSIIIEDVTYKYTIDPVNGFSVINAGTGMVLARLGFVPSSFTPCIELKDSSAGKVVRLTSGTLTADQTQKTIDASGFIPVVIGSHDVAAQSGSISPFLLQPVANTANFLISGYLNVTTYTAGTLLLLISFKDVHGSIISAYHLVSVTSAGYSALPAIQIRALAGYSLNIVLADGTPGNIYDAGVVVTQITSN